MSPTDARFHRLIWLMPLVSAAHLAEEAPGFVPWVRSLGGELTWTEFLALNGLFFPAFTAICARAAIQRSWTPDMRFAHSGE